MEDFFQNHDPSEDPLWQAMLPGLARDLGESHRLAEADFPAELWNTVASDRVWGVKGAKCNLNRFMGALREVVLEDPRWHSRLLINSFVCLQCDLLKGARLMELLPKLRPGAGDAPEDDEEQRAMRVPGEMENAITKAVNMCWSPRLSWWQTRKFKCASAL